MTLDLRSVGKVGGVEAQTLSGSDEYATNTAERPERVRPAANPTVEVGGDQLTISLPPVSRTVVTWRAAR